MLTDAQLGSRTYSIFADLAYQKCSRNRWIGCSMRLTRHFQRIPCVQLDGFVLLPGPTNRRFDFMSSRHRGAAFKHLRIVSLYQLAWNERYKPFSSWTSRFPSCNLFFSSRPTEKFTSAPCLAKASLPPFGVGLVSARWWRCSTKFVAED